MRHSGDEFKQKQEQHYKNQAAHTMGKHSAEIGLTLLDNPFEGFTEEYQEWISGWNSVSL